MNWQRVLAAVGCSIAFNVVIVALDALVSPTTPPLSRPAAFVDLLEAPGALAAQLAPSGHTMAIVGSRMLLWMLSSVLLYAVAFWAMLTIVSWLRDRFS